MANTGYKGYTTLEKYYTDNGAATGVTKANTSGQPDFIDVVYDIGTCPLDPTPPSVPAGLRLASAGTYELNMTWNPSTDNIGMDHYEVYLNSVLWGTSALPSATITELSPATTYTVSIIAVDIDGNKSASGVAKYFSTLSQFYINLDSYSASIDFANQLVTINVASNYPSYIFMKPTWVGITGVVSGSGSVVLHVAKNTSGMERYAAIEIIFAGDTIATFQLTQQ